MKNIKSCTKCILPNTYRNISFNKDGVCNYCTSYEANKAYLNTYPIDLLKQRIENIKGKYDYDALIGISGGKDSSYIALRLMKDYNLKVLTFTYDNGFLTDYGKNNIKLVTEKLGIEHFYFKPDWDVHKVFYRKALINLGLPCLGCSYLAFIVMHKIAIEKNIPLMIHGRSRFQMFKEFSPKSADPFLNFIISNLQAPDQNKTINSALTALKKSKFFLKQITGKGKFNKQVENIFFADLKHKERIKVAPELLAFFLYEKYDEKMMMDRLEKELGWERPESKEEMTHTDCLIHDAAGYIYSKVMEYPLLSQELSVAIREGYFTREEALDRLSKEEYLNDVPKESMAFLCDKFDLKPEEIENIIKSANNSQKKIKKILKIRSKFKRKLLFI